MNTSDVTPPLDRPKVIACATVIEEMLPLLPVNAQHQTLDFGLHVKPEALHRKLQEAIDASDDASVVLLGYGLCSMAAIGLRATHCPLVMPKVDDCIAIFLGSRAAHLAQSRAEPGSYYLTKGWIEAGDTPFSEYELLVTRHGPKKAERMMHLCFKNYTRLALINTGQHELSRYRDYAQATAERFGLRYEEIPGSTELVSRLIAGPWDDAFLVVPQGQTIEHGHFFPLSAAKDP